MKICITSSGITLQSPCEPRFGRCSYLVFVDDTTMQYEALENPALSSSGGAGIKAAQTIAQVGADVLLTGSVGPNAQSVLEASEIEVVTGINGTVEEALGQYLKSRGKTVSGSITSQEPKRLN